MACPHCDSDRVAFAVPEDLREFAPDGSNAEAAAEEDAKAAADAAEAAADTVEVDAATLCSVCLRVASVGSDGGDGDDGGSDPVSAPAATDFSAVGEFFPDGQAGIELALLLGRLDSLALNRTEIVELCERIERDGADPLLALDRLETAGAVRPHFDLDRRRAQLRQVLE